MRRLFLLLVFLVASVWLGLTFLRHPGFVFISYHNWMVQMPFWFALLGMIIVFGALYLIFNSVERLQFLWYRFQNWMQFRREHRSYSKTQHGLALLIEARWSKAERLLLAGANQSVEPLMNYLGAARAAQGQGALDRRDNYLRKAYQIAPNADLAIGLTQAELEIEQNQFEQALATLNRLRKESPKHPRVLRLLEKVYVHFGDWKNLLDILPWLRKAKVLTAEQAEQFEKNIFCEMLRAATLHDPENLHLIWDQMPRSMRRNPEVVLEYSRQLLRFHEAAEAEALIQKTLKYTWNAPLVKLYSTLPFDNLNRQLVIVGAWLKAYGPQPELLLTLGKLCARIQLWGKAKDYFEKCLAIGPNPEASLEYAKLLEELGDEQEAVEKYRDGLGAVAT